MKRNRPNRYIVLLRGINVGGRKKLPMQPLRESIGKLGFENVRSFIQSGNLIMDSPRRAKPQTVARRIAEMLTENGFPKVPVLVLLPEQLQRMLQQLPFSDDGADPKSIHFFFCLQPNATPDVETATSVLDASEQLAVGESVVYLHAPNGIARSKVVAKIDALLGTPVTARNLRTVDKLLALANTD